MKPVIEHLNIFGMRLDMVQIPEVIEIIQGWIENKNYHNYITVLTANEAVLGKHDVKVRDTVNASSLAVADGISLICYSRLRGFNLKRRVYGPELLLEFLRLTEDSGYKHFFMDQPRKFLKNSLITCGINFLLWKWQVPMRLILKKLCSKRMQRS